MAIWSIILTSTLTIVGGVLIYSIGQIISKFHIDPVNNLLQTIGEVQYTLYYFANCYCNPGTGDREKMDEASIALRHQASQLLSKAQVIKRYKLFCKRGYIPKQDSLIEAITLLTGLSNSVHKGDPNVNYERQSKYLSF